MHFFLKNKVKIFIDWLKTVRYEEESNVLQFFCDVRHKSAVLHAFKEVVKIAGWVIPKTQKMVLDASLINTRHYWVSIKDKVEQSRKKVVPSPKLRCSSYWKKNLSGHPRLRSLTLLFYTVQTPRIQLVK